MQKLDKSVVFVLQCNFTENELTDSTIFNGQTSPEVAATQTTEQQSVLTALVGETQKYKTTEDLAKAYANADQFIEQLKEENRQLREKATSAKTIDEVLERISATNKAPQEDTPVVSGLNPDEVQQLVAKTLEDRDKASVRTNNLLKADKAMKEKFGEAAKATFASMASTPELQRTLMEIAAIDPDKFVAIFNTTPAAPVGNSMDSSSVTTTVVPNGGNRAAIEGTKEWAAKIRKDNPNEYWSTEFQSKMQRLVAKNPQLYFG